MAETPTDNVQSSSAMECLILVSRFLGVELSRSAIVTQHPQIALDTCGPEVLLKAAEANGLCGETSFVTWSSMRRMVRAMPFIGQLSNGEFIIIAGLAPAKNEGESGPVVLVQDPQATSLELLRVPAKEFRKRWSGRLVLLRKLDDADAPIAPYDFKWIFSEVGKFKGILLEIGLISLFIHGVSFVTAIFTMIVFDKVIGYEGLATLHTLFAFAVAVICVGGILGYFRSLMLAGITVKLDILIAQLTSNRILDLPMRFFEDSSTGTLAKKIQEASAIREFVTGRLLATLIEMSAVFLFLPVLIFLSVKLTYVVLALTVILMLQMFLSLRIHRKNLTRLYKVESDRQALIVETVTGIETIKSLSLEDEHKKKWMEKTSEVVTSQKKMAQLNGLLQESSGFLQKLMQLVIIWFGAQLVLAGELTIGTLIAFNILSGRIAGPLVQSIGLASKYQETSLSVRMLGSILNGRPERLSAGGVTPALTGEIVFEDVEYAYDKSQPPLIQNLSFRIPPGATIGVVGKSGSGKSTIAKLLMGFDMADSGYIRIDGYNLREFDLRYLRQRVASVFQQSTLFKGSIAENIVAGNAISDQSEAIEAARLTQAHEFIRTLPQRYNTMLEENAANFSGGQKQRLSLARAVLRTADIVVLDEAMSAIDAHMEEEILLKLLDHWRNQTVINISHRMSTMPLMDYVLVLDKGKLVDFAPHDILIRRCDAYRDLWPGIDAHLPATSAAPRTMGVAGE